MQKLLVTAAGMLTVSIVLLGSTVAQQTAASTPKPAPKSASTAKTATTAKPHATTAAKSTQPLTLATQKDKVSYAIGMSIGQSMKKDALDIDPNILAQGLKDGIAGSKPLLSEEEAKTVLTEFRTEMAKKTEAEAQRISETNKQAGQQFLAANKTKEGVVTLPSGLQYKVLKEGTGPKPAATDTVVCNYRGHC